MHEFSTELIAPESDSTHFVIMSAHLPIGERLTCTADDACAFASIGKTKLYQLINDGALATTRVGKRRLIVVSSLKGFLARGQTAGAQEA